MGRKPTSKALLHKMTESKHLVKTWAREKTLDFFFTSLAIPPGVSRRRAVRSTRWGTPCRPLGPRCPAGSDRWPGWPGWSSEPRSGWSRPGLLSTGLAPTRWPGSWPSSQWPGRADSPGSGGASGTTAFCKWKSREKCALIISWQVIWSSHSLKKDL